jgi:hypothetical protein
MVWLTPFSRPSGPAFAGSMSASLPLCYCGSPLVTSPHREDPVIAALPASAGKRSTPPSLSPLQEAIRGFAQPQAHHSFLHLPETVAAQIRQP